MAALRPLFRPEAVQAQSQQWLGGVQLVRPLSLSWITAGVVLVAIAAGSFLSLASYTRKASASGVLAPDVGLIRLVPHAAGTVLERRVAEGQVVREGDVMFVLAVERPLLANAAQAQVRRSLEERRRSLAEATQTQRVLTEERRTALASRLRALQTEQAQIQAEAGLQQQRRELAEKAPSSAWNRCAPSSSSRTRRCSPRPKKCWPARRRTKALVRQSANLQHDQAELQGELRALPLLASGVAGGLERDLAQLERESVEQDAEHRLVVRSPRDGSISTVLAEPGQSVSPASALATLLPAGARLQAQLYAPSSAVGFVQPGQEVRLRFEAFAYQKYGHQPGHVVQVSRTPLAASEMAALALPAAAAGGEPMFRITVALDEPASELPLAAGMRLQADVLLERRRLVEWLFEPLLGFKGRM
jgi:membrane fusion protein